jgi:hypothetical protein
MREDEQHDEEPQIERNATTSAASRSVSQLNNLYDAYCEIKRTEGLRLTSNLQCDQIPHTFLEPHCHEYPGVA